MPVFSANPDRLVPYKDFAFRLKWDGVYVAGVSKVSTLKRTGEAVGHREGGDPSNAHRSPGRSKFEAITLERGLTQDKGFHDWAEGSLADTRKDIHLEVYNEAGQMVTAYKIHRCWVSEYQATPDLDANANAVAIEHIKLENEGWERDDAGEQAQGSTTEAS